jgi:hypothetical protein
MPTTPSWKVGVEHAQRGRRLAGLLAVGQQRLGNQHRLLAHAALDLAALAVDAVQQRPARRRAPASSVSRHSMPSVMSTAARRR